MLIPVRHLWRFAGVLLAVAFTAEVARQSAASVWVGQACGSALAGLGVLLFCTAGGGLLGYRQANACRRVRSDAGRCLPRAPTD